MFRSVQQNMDQYRKDGAVIVDVRSPDEYRQGHVQGSINIPLPQIGDRAKELDSGKPILLCCASGNRSGQATAILKAKGFKNAVNAGPWVNIKV